MLVLVVVTIVTMSLALLTAAIMSREALRRRTFYRFVLYIPNSQAGPGQVFAVMASGVA